ncbi:hypothetical protein P879_08589 [Paragonimus westermani]|uniref:Uncharacterized protein n=1 Tax=Paragonimus westermani TaxID=34504 RepID=A0A8T0DJ97_9TREM|nr:hypothetical protein P879_08589 [Paragonimus westermani]
MSPYNSDFCEISSIEKYVQFRFSVTSNVSVYLYCNLFVCYRSVLERFLHTDHSNVCYPLFRRRQFR